MVKSDFKKGTLELVVLFSSLAVLGALVFAFSFSSKREQPQFKPTVTFSPTAFLTDYSGFFELQADKTKLSLGDQVVVSLYVTTTGEPLDGLNTVVQWDQNDFDYVSDQAADLPGDEQAYSFWAGPPTGLSADKAGEAGPAADEAGPPRNMRGNTQGRLLQLGVQRMTPPLKYMTTSHGVQTLIYTLVLKSLVDNPASSIELSATKGDLMVHFSGQEYFVNSVDQSLADQNKLSLKFLKE